MKKSLLLLATSVLSVSSANSCGCNTPVGLNEAKSVFIGKVVKIVKKGRYEITFQISSVQKGKLRSKKIAIYTPCLMDGCCGIPFEINEVYKVFAYENDKQLYTDQCTETARIK
jgi:hypothetical protein